MTRRTFSHLLAALPAAAQNSGSAPRPQLCIFSKHMAALDWKELGKAAREIGFDGVDLTVREKGHVLPERAAEDLPRAVEAIRAAGVSVPMITTNLLSASDATTRPILSTAAKLKIPYFKLGYHRYRDGMQASLERTRAGTASLVSLAKEYGIEAGFHNHSGDYVGTAVWDIRAITADMDPKSIGYYFDPAHATIEGGLHGWKLSLEIALQRLKMVAVKDFVWEEASGKWRVKWTPLGQGMVDFRGVFAALSKSGFRGPVSLHVEYDTADEMAAIRQDFAFMKKAAAAAYGG